MILVVSTTYNVKKHTSTVHDSMVLSISWYMSSIRNMVMTSSIADMHDHFMIFQARVWDDKLFGMCAKK